MLLASTILVVLILLCARPLGIGAHEIDMSESDLHSLLQMSVQSIPHVSNSSSHPKSHLLEVADSQLKPDEVSLRTQTLVCCFVAIASACLIILVSYVWKALVKQSTQKNFDLVGDRTPLLDNAKAFAIILVIFGHILNGREFAAHARDLPHVDKLRHGLKMLDMPMFCLVSGLCSQKPPTAKRVRALIRNIALPAVIHVCFINPVVLHSLTHPSQWYENVSDFVKLRTFLLWAYTPWYLVALVLWRTLSFICYPLLSASSALIMAVLISCIGGYLGPVEIIRQSIGFLAYFAIGYVLDLNAIMERVSILPRWTRVAAAGCVLLWIIGIVMPNVFPIPLPDAHKSYWDNGKTFQMPDHIANWEILFFWTRRLTKITVDILPCLVLLMFVIPRGQTFLTPAGQHTLYAYLYHQPAVHWYLYGILQLELPKNIPWMQSSVCGVFVVALCHVAFSLALVLLLTSQPWRWLFSWAVQPTWANPLMQRLIPDNDE